MTRHLIARAEEFAALMHEGQHRRYTGEPYTVHTRAVAALVAEAGLGPEVVAAAHLHDVVEDTGTSIDAIRSLFGQRVAHLVLEVTDVSRLSDGNRAVRKALDRDHLAAAGYDGQSIKLADLIDNTASIVRHDPAFARVFLAEMRELLGVLTRGHPGLHERAYRVWSEATRSLAGDEVAA